MAPLFSMDCHTEAASSVSTFNPMEEERGVEECFYERCTHTTIEQLTVLSEAGRRCSHRRNETTFAQTSSVYI